jgi:hypothetical protein
MERDPRLEHTANSIRMADDFSEPPRPAHERVVGRKPHCPNNIYMGVEGLTAKQVVWISGGLRRCREPLYCPPQRLFEPLLRSVKPGRAPQLKGEFRPHG